MCHILNHTCVCNVAIFGADHTKLMLIRKIVCDLEIDCTDRYNPPEIFVKKCDDFHISREARFIPYHCAICSTEDIAPGTDRKRGRQAGLREFPVQSSVAEMERALSWMDEDFITEFHHLDKQRTSGRTYFLHDAFRTGSIDPVDEYTAELWLTGNNYKRTGPSRSDLSPVSDGQRRGREYFEDPSPKAWLPDKVTRDKEFEHWYACRKQEAHKPKYDYRRDEGLWPGDDSRMNPAHPGRPGNNIARPTGGPIASTSKVSWKPALADVHRCQ